MVYVGINEKKTNGETLLKFLRGIDKNSEFVSFMDEEREFASSIDEAMKTPRVKSGNSLREILSSDGL